jgi:hypothetical protein
MEVIQIYCGVKYVDKDTAKSHKAKWDMKEKKWYFEFILKEFIYDEKIHTRQFKPFKLKYINCDEYFKNAPIESHKIYDLHFQKAQSRNRKFIEETTPVDMTEKHIIVLKQN